MMALVACFGLSSVCWAAAGGGGSNGEQVVILCCVGLTGTVPWA